VPLAVENWQIYSVFEVSVPPIYSQLLWCFPRYGKRDFSTLSVDKAVDEFWRFSPQVENAWDKEPTPHPEGGAGFILHMAWFGVCPQYPHPLLLLLNP